MSSNAGIDRSAASFSGPVRESGIEHAASSSSNCGCTSEMVLGSAGMALEYLEQRIFQQSEHGIEEDWHPHHEPFVFTLLLLVHQKIMSGNCVRTICSCTTA